MGSTEVREPIPNGFVKLASFIVVVALILWSAYWWWSKNSAVVMFQMVGIFGLFYGVKVFHPKGWTDWVREFWFWNVRGADECFCKNKDGKLRREVLLHESREVYRRYGFRNNWCTIGSWHIMIRRSGWSFLKGQALVGWKALDRFWSVRQGKTENVRETGRSFSDHTTTVMLKQSDGTCLELTIEDALQAIEDLTILEPCSNASWCYKVEGTRPFSHILQMKQPTASLEVTPASVV